MKFKKGKRFDSREEMISGVFLKLLESEIKTGRLINDKFVFQATEKSISITDKFLELIEK